MPQPASPFSDCGADAMPFDGAEAAWFWYVAAAQAMADGARIKAGLSVIRPCEPIDIFKVVERLYRAKRLSMDHLLVLRHYGRRGMAPDERRVKEIRGAKLWCEAMHIIESVLIEKKIVNAKPLSWLISK